MRRLLSMMETRRILIARLITLTRALTARYKCASLSIPIYLLFSPNFQIKISIDEDFDGPLYVYYELTNFFQNHRVYIASVNYYQLAASAQYETEADLKSYCTYKYLNGSKLINPCGLIANSFFTGMSFHFSLRLCLHWLLLFISRHHHAQLFWQSTIQSWNEIWWHHMAFG